MASAHMPEEFFDTVAHHLPPEQPVGPKGGRPRVGHRIVVRVIWFVLTTGARWEDVPPELGCSGRTAHRRLRAWEEAGIWDRLHADLLAAAEAGRQARPRHGDHRRRDGAGLRRRRGDRPQPRGPCPSGGRVNNGPPASGWQVAQRTFGNLDGRQRPRCRVRAGGIGSRGREIKRTDGRLVVAVGPSAYCYGDAHGDCLIRIPITTEQ